MSKYRKKPVVIEAVAFTRNNFDEIVSFTNGAAHTLRIERTPNGKCTCVIPTLEGEHIASEGDFIIKGVHGEFYPCKPDIFKKTYEEVDRPTTNADRIRAMSDEELAEDFCKTVLGVMNQLGVANTGSMEDAIRTRLEWLKQPAEVDNG